MTVGGTILLSGLAVGGSIAWASRARTMVTSPMDSHHRRNKDQRVLKKLESLEAEQRAQREAREKFQEEQRLFNTALMAKVVSR